MITISSSVGRSGANRRNDVLSIQKALNKIPQNKGGAIPKLNEDGLIGAKTIGAILTLQRVNAGLAQDGRINVNRPTLACINTLLNGPNFSDKNLYGKGGRISAADIMQDDIGDCYFVATLAALARNKPQAITNAITYVPLTQRFNVRLYTKRGHAQVINVSQWELEENVLQHGGSNIDNTKKYENTWPAVIETAYAKMNDSNAANGLTQGYRKLDQGGFAEDAMMTITGNLGRLLKYTFYPTLGQNGSVYLLGAQVALIVRQGKSITLSTDPERGGDAGLQDGLVDSHVYTVMSLASAGTDWNIIVRNPWGTNLGVDEGRDTASANITVSLLRLVSTRGLGSFEINR